MQRYQADRLSNREHDDTDPVGAGAWLCKCRFHPKIYFQRPGRFGAELWAKDANGMAIPAGGARAQRSPPALTFGWFTISREQL